MKKAGRKPALSCQNRVAVYFLAGVTSSALCSTLLWCFLAVFAGLAGSAGLVVVSAATTEKVTAASRAAIRAADGFYMSELSMAWFYRGIGTPIGRQEQ